MYPRDNVKNTPEDWQAYRLDTFNLEESGAIKDKAHSKRLHVP